MKIHNFESSPARTIAGGMLAITAALSAVYGYRHWRNASPLRKFAIVLLFTGSSTSSYYAIRRSEDNATAPRSKDDATAPLSKDERLRQVLRLLARKDLLNHDIKRIGSVTVPDFLSSRTKFRLHEESDYLYKAYTDLEAATKRIKAIEKYRDVINKLKLNRLHIPETEVIEIECDKQKYVILKQKYFRLAGYRLNEMSAPVKHKPDFQEAVRHLATFIKKTGFCHVTRLNIIVSKGLENRKLIIVSLKNFTNAKEGIRKLAELLPKSMAKELQTDENT